MIKLFQDKILANKKPSAKNSYTDEFSVSVGGIQLGNCHLAQYLGVIIDENLNWKPHVQYLQKKLSTAAGIITKMRYYLKEKKCCGVALRFFSIHICCMEYLVGEVQLNLPYTPFKYFKTKL